jgi:hypothetical protein
MLWSAIGDGAYIKVTDQSSIAKLESQKRKADHDPDPDIVDVTGHQKPSRKGSTSRTPIPTEDDEITILETAPTAPAARFKQAPKCRVSQSSIDSKGLGLRATTKLRAGDIIVVERPFLIVDYPPPVSQIEKQYDSLSAIERLLFHSFHAKSNGEVNHKVSDIITNNVIPLGSGSGVEGEEVNEGEPTRSGMFRYICRVNHSCVPNARWTWHDDQRQMGKWCRVTRDMIMC